MKKRYFILFYFILFYFISFSQNLVPNSSFEFYNSCPDTCCLTMGSTISAANNWINAGGFSPDYFNPCDTNVVYPKYGVPFNQYGFQSARTGLSYAGIITSYLYSGGDSVREYIEIQLLDTLITGKNYSVSFYVSLADSCPYAANSIGAYFSNNLISYPLYSYPLPFVPQIKNNSFNNPLINKAGWTEVVDTFIAQGGEKYITIGNFYNDANTDTVNLNYATQNYPWAYYYVDDANVTCLDCAVGIDDALNLNSLQIYPNPSTGVYKIKSNYLIKKFEIYNSVGRMVYSNFLDSNEAIINLYEQQQGIYFLIIQTQNFTQTRKLILTKKST